MKLAVVGAGYWGPNLVRNLSSLREVEAVVVCDKDLQRLELMKERHPAVVTTCDLDAVLGDKSVDGVLLATPITFGAGVLKMKDLSPDLPATTLAIGVASAAITGFFAIRGLIRWLGRAGFGVFFVYRLVLAAVILLNLGR